MRLHSQYLAAVISLTQFASVAVAGKNCTAGPQLKHWPVEAAQALDRMICSNAHSGRYAVFDMDNTSYQFDLEESLLPFLENKGILTRDTMDPSLKLIPFIDSGNYTETLYSYYNRLCEVDDMVCYPWVAQIFSGISLRDLKGYVDELMSLNETIPATYLSGGEVTPTEVTPPKVFAGQVELYNKLMANGIEVYVVSAASEELVRMVAADPKYGYNVKPENVIGVSMLLKNQTGGLTSARKQIKEGDYDEQINLDSVMTPYLWTPATWMTGKWAAILSYIDEWKKPILVGGDTPDSDGPMLFHGVDVSRGGIHLWVNRKGSAMAELNKMIEEHTHNQQKEGLEVTANKNWVIVKPEELHSQEA